MIFDRLRNSISDTNPLRLMYHHFLAVVAAIYFRFPSRYLTVIGVTGTKGKTTTTNLITGVLNEAGFKVGMTSTINFQVGNMRWNNTTKKTTLGPFFLQGLLRQMVDSNCTHAVIEVSSHALSQNRVWGINFDMAVFTNISEEHIEYHGSFENYLRAKGLLFSRLNRSERKPNISKVSILNKDDPNFVYFDQFLVDREYTFGMGNGTCFATDVKGTAYGTEFILHVPNNQISVSMKLPGEFNVYNALAAATVGLANNVSLNIIKSGLERTGIMPGRFESIDCGQKYSIIVDYAHTADSLEKVLALYRSLTKGKLFVVFGCTGGGRDKSKRPKMGAVADKYADYIVVTDDDPCSDNEWDIIQMVAAGIKRKEGQGFWKIADRRQAIKLVLSQAQEGDTVILAGKGAEEIQLIHGKKIPWDDRKVVRELLSHAITVEIGTKNNL